jgi:predicted RNA-binding protein (virulence factor B family)
VATTQTPLAMVGEVAYLRVLSHHHSMGAFLDWGLEKDLLLPRREYAGGVHPGGFALVFVTIDERSNRIVATCRLNRHLNLSAPTYGKGQAVKLIVESETPLGYRVVVNHAHLGLLYHTELAGPLTIGQTLDGFVRTVRVDGKIDVGLDPAGPDRILPFSEQILRALEKAGGHLPYHDGSTPESIRNAFGMSKKAFKQAIGGLFRQRLIVIEPDGIRLVNIP